MSDSPIPPPDADPELARRAARELIDHLSETNKIGLTELGAIGRWLTASLLAVNGAAGLAVFNAEDKLATPTLDAAPFVGGVLAALLTGVLLQWANGAGLLISGEALGAAIVVEQTGVFDDNSKGVSAGMASKGKRLAIWPQLAGWVSAALFGAGAVVTGLTGARIDHANDRRCLTIQGDMLAAQPRRGDDPALFQALGCKPQGAGGVFANEIDVGLQALSPPPKSEPLPDR